MLLFSVSLSRYSRSISASMRFLMTCDGREGQSKSERRVGDGEGKSKIEDMSRQRGQATYLRKEEGCWKRMKEMKVYMPRKVSSGWYLGVWPEEHQLSQHLGYQLLMRQRLSRFHDTHDSCFNGYGSVFLHSLHVVTLLEGGHGYSDFAHLAAAQGAV